LEVATAVTVKQIETLRTEINLTPTATATVTEAEASGMVTAARTMGVVTAVGTKGMVTTVVTKDMVSAIGTKGIVTRGETMVWSVEAGSRLTLMGTKGMKVLSSRGLAAEAIPTEMKDMLAMSRAMQIEMKVIVTETMAIPPESRASACAMQQKATGILATEAESKAVIGEMMAETVALTGMLAEITVPAGSPILIHEWRKLVAQMI